MKLQVLAILALISLFFSFTQAGGQIGSLKPRNFSPETDPTDKLAFDAIINLANDQETPLTFSKVIECRTQVVAGLIYHLKVQFEDPHQQYDLELYVIPWDQYTEVQSFKLIEKKTHEEENPSEEDIEEAVQNYIIKSIYQEYKEEGIVKFQTVGDFKIVDKVVEGEGMKYTCKILLISPYIDFNNKAGEYRGFEVSLIYQAWMNKFSDLQINKYEYTEEDLYEQVGQQENQSLGGGWSNYEFSETEDEIREVIQQILSDELPKKKLSTNYEVLSCKTQVVSGYNIKIHIIIEDYLEFEAIIYYQPWKKVKQLTSFVKMDSERPDSTLKRHNGKFETIEFEEEDEHFQRLINKGVSDYLRGNGFHQGYEILKATKNVIPQVKYNLILKIQKKNFECQLLVQAWNDLVEVLSFSEFEKEQNHSEL